MARTGGMGRGRAVLFSLLAVALFFLLAEAALWMGGFGKTPGPATILDIYGPVPELFKPAPQGQGRLLVLDDEDYRREELALPKPPGEYRIFCLGGSTAFGVQVSQEEAYPARLQELLKQENPGKQVRVINMGRSALDSFRVRSMAGYVIARLEPDMLVVYCGHNDFINAGRVVDVQAMARLGGDRAARRRAAFSILGKSRVFRLLESLVLWLKEQGAAAADPRTPENFLEKRRALLDQAFGEYQRTMEDLARLAREARVPLVLCTVASVEQGIAPFDAMWDPSLSFKDRVAAAGLEGAARISMLHQEPDQAVYKNGLALQIDPRNAALLYQQGQALLALEKWPEAGDMLSRARDEDLSGWRAPSQVNPFLRDFALREGIALADVEQALASRCPHDIIDRSLFADHIHPNAEGHAVIAQTLARTVMKNQLLDK